MQALPELLPRHLPPVQPSGAHNAEALALDAGMTLSTPLRLDKFHRNEVLTGACPAGAWNQWPLGP